MFAVVCFERFYWYPFNCSCFFRPMYRTSSRVIIILQFFLLLEFVLISENQAIIWFWSSPQTCLHFSSWCLHYLTGGWARLWNVKNCTPVSLGHNVLILPLADQTVHTIIIESICQCTECLGLLSVNWLWHSDAMRRRPFPNHISNQWNSVALILECGLGGHLINRFQTITYIIAGYSYVKCKGIRRNITSKWYAVAQYMY